MTTFADIQKAAEGNLSTFVDDATPAGHFGAVTKILGYVTTYLLADNRNVSESVVKGHVVITGDQGKQTALGYKGEGLIGGYYMGRVESYEKTFAQMV